MIRTLLLLVTMSLLAYIFGDRRLFFNQIILSTIIIIQIAELVRFVNQTNRELARLFLAVRHDDFSVTFRQLPVGASFKYLQASMTDVIEAFKQAKVEKEVQYQFLQLLVEQLHVGIISIEGENHIVLINNTAEKTLGITGIKNWRLVSLVNTAFAEEIAAIGDNGRKLLELKSPDGSTRFLSVDVRSVLLLDKPHKLITFQDIDSEIEQKEIEAWHKLIRILTHEIMNSVTPIASLTETMQALLQERGGTQKPHDHITEDNIADIRFSLNTIHKRSEGLLTFVEHYRKLTRVPKPSIELVELKAFMQELGLLMEPQLNARGIHFGTTVSDTLSMHFDRKLIAQVLINLITNSMQALEGRADGTIQIVAGHDGTGHII
ncbi:MAG: ATP-binding protein [Bacteroidia bacterium]|nr:ATP-binding protein [Bacteroidia bacterium]